MHTLLNIEAVLRLTHIAKMPVQIYFFLNIEKCIVSHWFINFIIKNIKYTYVIYTYKYEHNIYQSTLTA